MPAERGALPLSLVVGSVVFAKTLVAPFYQDDLIQRAMALGGFPAPRGPFALYDFARAGERARLVDLGVLPWWTDERFTLRFFRPLSSGLLFLEHRWSGSALAMHALSFAWWAAAVAAAWWLFRSLLAERVAAIATLVFALAPCHEPALALLAQREVLVVMTFGILGLAVLARTPPSPRRMLASGALFAASLAAGEYGLCLGGYVLAMAISEPEWQARARRLVPFAVPAAIYLFVRAALGYGAAGTGFYRDPIHAPASFFAKAPRSFVTLVVDAWSTFDASRFPLWAASALIVVLFAVLVFLRPRGPVRWLVAGAFLALLPVLASAPGQRLVGPAMIGVAPAVATVVDRAIASRGRPSLVLVAAALSALHLVHAPIASFAQAGTSLQYARRLESRSWSLHEASVGAVGVVGLGAWETAFFTGVVPEPAERERMPWRVLVTARHALMLRTGARAVDVVVPRGQGFFPVGVDDMFRPEDAPLHAGDERDVSGMHVLVVSDGHGPTPPRIRFTFDRDLDDPAIVWRSQTRDGFEVIAPPRQGFGVQLSP